MDVKGWTNWPSKRWRSPKLTTRQHAITRKSTQTKLVAHEEERGRSHKKGKKAPFKASRSRLKGKRTLGQINSRRGTREIGSRAWAVVENTPSRNYFKRIKLFISANLRRRLRRYWLIFEWSQWIGRKKSQFLKLK